MHSNVVIVFLCIASSVVLMGGNKATTSIAWTASWSFDDNYVAIGNDNGELAIYETRKWKKIKSWNYKATTITRVEWNPAYPILAVAAVSNTKNKNIVQLYDAEKAKIIKTLPEALQGRGVTWSPTGEEVAYVGTKGMISIYSKDGGLTKILSYRNPHSLMDIDWHPAKNILLVVEEDIYLWDIDQDTLVATYDDGSKNKGILCCQWHPTGDLFITGDYGHENEGGEPSYLKFWTAGGHLLKQLSDSKYEYRNVRWSPGGNYLAAAGNTLLVYDRMGQLITNTKFDDNNLWGVEWNHKGDKIIITDQAGNVRITNIKGEVLTDFVH
jgi:WD40 repeat protein